MRRDRRSQERLQQERECLVEAAVLGCHSERVVIPSERSESRNPWRPGREPSAARQAKGFLDCGLRPPLGMTGSYRSAASTALSRTLAPFTTSSGFVNSRGEWLMPPTLGTKIIAIGAIWAISCASCPAPLGIR